MSKASSVVASVTQQSWQSSTVSDRVQKTPDTIITLVNALVVSQID